MRNRVVLVLSFFLPALLVIVFFYMRGEKAWEIWNIPTIQPSFIDARIITGGAESHELGFKPEIENPQDPYGRLFNLPSAWKLLFLLGINQSHTSIFAGILAVSFFVGLVLFAGSLNSNSVFLLAICTFSPPVMLALERGNVDLLIFLLCVLSLVWLEKNQILSLSLLWIAGILKIYPIFGLTCIFYLDKKNFSRLFMFFMFAFGAYSLLTLDSFRRAFSNTEVGFDLSYGLGVLPFYVEIVSGSYLYTLIASLASILFVILIVFLVLNLWALSHYLLVGTDIFHLSAFRLGAGIYIGTFLLGNNWDYRLIFLLFTIPQLIDWGKQTRVAKYTLVATMISFFYLWIKMFIPFAYFLDEIANWMVFAGLFYLMIISLPEWARDEAYLFFERYKRKNV